MGNRDYQLDEIQSHHNKKLLGIYVREFQDWIHWEGNIHIKYRQHLFLSWGPGSHEKKKMS